MRIVFMGTPEFSVPALEALVEGGHEICAVYTQPPRPAGRGQKARTSPVQRCAEELGLQVLHPVSLRGDKAQAEFAALEADVAVVVAYGLILPQAVLDAPKRGCLNIHASLLPRWRGAAPIHRAILSGDARTGVCIMQMDAGLDTGPVLLREETAIGETETTGQLHDRLSVMGAAAILKVLAHLGDLHPEPQPDTGVTYANKIDKAEARVDWSRPAVEVIRQINGLSPFPGAWSEAANERIKFLRATSSDLKLDAGVTHAASDGLTIGAAGGSVFIVDLQRAGKRVASSRDALQGWVPPERFT